MKEAIWLWVDRPRRAKAFLYALCIMLVLLVWLNQAVGWRWLLESLDFPEGTPDRVVISQNIALSGNADIPTILVLGGSTVREFAPDDETISAAVSSYCGVSVRVIKAGSSSQDIATAWTFAERTLETRLDAVVLGINYYRFTERRTDLGRGLDTRRIPLPASTTFLARYSRELQKLPDFEPLHQTGILLGLEPRPVIGQSQQADTDENPDSQFMGRLNGYRPPGLGVDEKQKIASTFLAMRGPAFFMYKDESFEELRAFTEYIQRAGIPVSFLVLPMDPVMDGVRPYFDPLLDEALRAFGVLKVSITDWRDKNLGLAASDFYDQQHLLPDGRKKVFPEFVRYLGDELPGCRGQGR